MQYSRKTLNQINLVRDAKALDPLKIKYGDKFDFYVKEVNKILTLWYDLKIPDKVYVAELKKFKRLMANHLNK